MSNITAITQQKQQVQALCQHGRYTEAIDACKALCEASPDDAEAWFILGALYGAQEQFGEAEYCCRNSIVLAPNVENTHCNLGIALLNMGRAEEAEVALREAIRIQPASPDAHCELGNALWWRNKHDEALSALTTSNVEIDDVRREMRANIQTLMNEKLDVKDPVKENRSVNFYLAYHGCNDKEIQVETAQLYLHAYPWLAYVSPRCRSASPAGEGIKIKIGFISMYLKHHSIGKTSKGLIEQLDRNRFEVVVIRFDEPVDQTARYICEHADKTLVIPPNLDGARALIEQQGLDILFYQDIGMEPLTYFLAFSRLAPVQCTTFGHPVTTGIPSMDYFVSTNYYEPENGQDHYSEKLFLLEDVASCAYYYRPELPATLLDRGYFDLNEDEHIYICPQALFKLHPEFDEIMAKILRVDPAGRIILIEGAYPVWEKQLRQRFQDHMPDVADRIRFLPQQKDGYFTNLLAVCDVVLDTIHFGGQNTTHEALSAGTPVVTWPGEFQRGRHAYGFYRKMGMMDCVAKDHDGYVDIAVRLANEPAFRERVIARILEKRHIVWQEERVVHEFERFFEKACEDFVASVN